ncbi:hypothetical protein ACH4NR_36945 [Streptomyces globisporus]|uniref:hypothetical protein n=1 Tax=Streptomyces globisporus TaxID=1908 RepID=UPI0037951FA6
MTRTHTPWPTGVIARYLTVAGSSLSRDDIAVDITCTQTAREKGRNDQEVGDITLVAHCSGCSDRDETTYEGLYLALVGTVLESFYGDHTREWAQTHAQTCRAIPKPA